MTITDWILAGVLPGLLISLVPSKRLGCMVLWIIPIAMVISVHIELSDPTRRPDAQDALGYLFGPLWPSLGALVGFWLGRAVRHWIVSRRARGESKSEH